MRDNDVVTSLVPLGFSLNEARAYGALLSGGPSTGYEVGQRAHIPRSAVYPALRRLVDAGAARAIPGRGSEPDRFVATPAEALVSLLRGRLDSSTRAFEDAAARAGTLPTAPDAYSVRGYARVLEEAERLVGAAQDKLLVSGWPREIGQLADALRAATGRRVFTVVFSHATLPDDIATELWTYGLDEASLESFWKHRLVVVSDDIHTLVGATTHGPDDGAVVSATAAIAELAASQIALDITLLAQRSGRETRKVMARMLGDRVGRLDELIAEPQAADGKRAPKRKR